MSESSIGYLLILPRFEYSAPRTVEEACSMLSQSKGKAKVMAGGTDVLVEMKKRKISPQYLISIRNITELDYIGHFDDGLRIGALVTHQAIADSDVVKEKFGSLATACKRVGTPQVRNVGTLAGNICMAGPSQDTIPALLALGAELKLVSSHGQRTVAIDEFFIGPFQSVLKDGELLTEIRIPTPASHSASCYKWLTKATMICETLVGVAVLIVADSTGQVCMDIKIGLGSVAPTPIRARQAEEVLRGKKIKDEIVEKAAKIAAEEIMPRSRAEYRRRMTSVLVKQAIQETWQTIRRPLF